MLFMVVFQQTVEQLVEDYIYQYLYKLFPEVNSNKLLGCITTKQVKEISREDWKRKTVGVELDG